MIKKIWILLLVVVVACQPEPSDVPFRLELRVLKLELAILSQDHDMITLLSDEVSELYKDKVTLEEGSLQEFNKLITTLQNSKAEDNEFTYLQKLKETVLNIPVDATARDEHLDGLMVYGNHLILTTETARDVMMDLYGWNEFEAQADALKESWDILEDRKPSIELLRYNDEKVDAQIRLFDMLRQAMREFINSIEQGDATTYDLCSNADVLRDHYINYLQMLTSVSSQDQEEILQ
ncbi:MAG: hypothetical protein HKN68_01355 [Saprospiraceae bacterium]|nr:hypothetical protein [Saprospiraceae bacterium]